jgi:hypothetical protein
VVSSTTRVFGAPIDKSEAPAARVYRIRKSFAVVQFDLASKGRIVFLPEGAEVLIIGPSRLRSCFEVMYADRIFSMFEVDLLGPWSMAIEQRRVMAAAVGACA